MTDVARFFPNARLRISACYVLRESAITRFWIHVKFMVKLSTRHGFTCCAVTGQEATSRLFGRGVSLGATFVRVVL